MASIVGSTQLKPKGSSKKDEGTWLIAMFPINQRVVYGLIHSCTLLWNVPIANRRLKTGKSITTKLDQIVRPGFVFMYEDTKEELEETLDDLEQEGNLISRYNMISLDVMVILIKSEYENFARYFVQPPEEENLEEMVSKDIVSDSEEENSGDVVSKVVVNDSEEEEEEELGDMDSEWEPAESDYSDYEEEPKFMDIVQGTGKRKQRESDDRVDHLNKKAKLSPSKNSSTSMDKPSTINDNVSISNGLVNTVITLMGDGVKAGINKPTKKATMDERLQLMCKLFQEAGTHQSFSDDKAEDVDAVKRNAAKSDGGTKGSNSLNSRGDRKGPLSAVRLKSQNCNANKASSRKEKMVPIGSGQTLITERLYIKISREYYKHATRSLLTALFTRKELATHSLTGKPSPAFGDKPAKPMLDERITRDIILAVSKKWGVKEGQVKSIITTKCSDEQKMYRARMLKQQKLMEIIEKKGYKNGKVGSAEKANRVQSAQP